MPAERSLTFRLALAVVSIAIVVPLWTVDFLPFSDAPEQIAVIATLRHWGDPAFSGAYTFDVGKSQYVLYHLVGAALAVPFGTAERANLVLLSLAGLSLPWAFRGLLRALGRDERLAFFAAPAFWSRPLLMGFLPYVAATPVVVWGLAIAAKQQTEPTRRRAIGLGALAVGLFFLHVDPFLLFVLAAVAMRLAFDVRGRPTLSGLVASARAVAWLGPGLAIAGAWTVLGGLRGSMDRGDVRFNGARDLLRELPSWSHDIWRSHVDEACSIAVWCAFVVLVLQRGRAKEDVRKLVVAAMPFAAAIVAYVALPYSIGPAVMLNVRIAVFVVLFAPLLIDRVEGLRGTIPLAVVAAATLVLSGDAILEMRRIDRDELGDVNRLLARVPPGARVLTLPFHFTSPRTHWAPWTFLGTYARSRKGGIAMYSFSVLPHWPLHVRPESAPPPRPIFWTFNACAYRNDREGAYYDYVIARGNVDPFRDAPPGPVFRRVDGERDIVLYERVPGATNPEWSVPDGGPCESRRSLERKESAGFEIPSE